MINATVVTKTWRNIYDGPLDFIPQAGSTMKFKHADVENAYIGPFEVLSVNVVDGVEIQDGKYIQHAVLIVGPDY